MKRKSISVTVERTVQAQQFQPCVVRVTETADMPPDMTEAEVKLELYKSASASVKKFMIQELKKWGEE